MSDDAAPRSGWRSFVVAVVLAAGATAVVLLARGTAEAAPTPRAQTATTVPAVGSSGTLATPSAPVSSEVLARGQQLYLTSCVSCHGVGGVGTPDGPSLLASGEASADFYLRTGRMPLAAPVPQPPSKPVAYSNEDIEALVAYVGSLCDRSAAECVPVPRVDTDRATLEEGSALYLANCAPCHGSVAVGGALSYGRHAPSLQETPRVQVAEAIRTGPGQMPKFGRDVLSDEQVNAIVKYVEYLHEPDSPGGLPLGFTGPVAEGFVALLVGLGALLLGIRWITREPEAPPRPKRAGQPGAGASPPPSSGATADVDATDERGADGASEDASAGADEVVSP